MSLRGEGHALPYFMHLLRCCSKHSLYLPFVGLAHSVLKALFLTLFGLSCVSPHLCKILSFPMFPQSPSAKFIFFLMVHNFPFSCMENNYSNCGFAPTNPLISSSLIGSLLCPMRSYGFWLHETSRLFFHSRYTQCESVGQACLLCLVYLLSNKKLTLRRGMNFPFWQRLSFDWHSEKS